MKTQSIIIALLFSLISIADAHSRNLSLSDDTVTTGPFSDCNPAMERNTFYLGFAGNQWLVFERRSDSTSMIAAKRCLQPLGTWDSSVTVISSSSIGEEKQLPVISSSRYPNGGREWMHSVAAWQQQKNGVWNIYVSSHRTDSAAWDPPIALTHDSVNCTNVRMVAYNDSTFIATWKKKSAVLFSKLTLPPSGSPLLFSKTDTLGPSNDDSLDYDIMANGYSGDVIWTIKDSTGNRKFLMRQFGGYPVFTIASPETLSIYGKISKPRFPSGYDYATLFLYELETQNRHEAHLHYDSYDDNILQDSSADYLNPSAFISVKVIAASGQSPNYAVPYMLDIFSMEENRGGDSLLLIQGFFGVNDSVRSAGYNRNSTIGSFMYNIPGFNGPLVPVVWESNRSGRPHLYSRMVQVDLGGGVKQASVRINSFDLEQNFPNPFNPSTTIRFSLFTGSRVTLKVIDLLGRTVETLIDKRLSAGNYETRWDGSRYSSGIYFCRMEAGTDVVTKKLILLK